MGVRNKNSTNYVHPDEPNLLDLHKAMGYRDGIPHLRVDLGSDTITITGSVNVGTEVKINNTDADSIPVHLTDDPIAVTQSTIPWQISKNTTANSDSNPLFVNFTNSTIGVTGNFYPATQPVSGTVALDTASLAALENISATISDGGNSITVDGTVNANVTFPTDVTNADSTYFFNVGRGLVAGQYLEFKNGYCGSMSSSTTGYTVWNEGTVYPWASWTSAARLFISSSSSSDTGQTILINGLDASYNKITETVTTAGTTGVTTTQSFLRINNVIIIAGTLNVGTIHTHLTNASGAVVGSMAPTLGRNKQSVFTIPAGYTAYIVYGNISSYKNGSGNVSGQVDMRVRPYGGVFLAAYTGIAANGQYSRDFTVPFEVTEKSDIDVRFAASGNGTTVTCDWEMILIANP